MNPREIDQFMRDSGFTPKRKTGSGMLWTDGLKYVNVAHRYSSPVALKNLQADVKRIVRQREGTAVQEGKIEMEPKIITAQPQPLAHRMQINLVKPEPPKPIQPAAEKDRRTMRRFTAVQLHQIYREIHLGSKKGLGVDQIAAGLAALGHRMSDGSAIDSKYVTTAMHNLRHPHWTERAQEWEQLANPPAPLAPVVPPITAPQPGTRSARTIPNWMLAFLTDPDLTAQEKIEMILAVGKA